MAVDPLLQPNWIEKAWTRELTKALPLQGKIGIPSSNVAQYAMNVNLTAVILSFAIGCA